MKNVRAFTTISACLLILSGGAALAANPPGTGEPGHNPTTGTGANCATAATSSPSAGAAGASGSPFNTTTGGVSGGNYAGSPGSNPLSANPMHAFSNYDVACTQVK
jgi:hypothetical protein